MPPVNKGKVYCSGGLFCPEEVASMERIAGALEEAGYSTYLPHRDGVEAFVMNSVNRPLSNLLVFRPLVRFMSRATFALDIYQVLECDYFVFNMNGAVPDEGGAVETGVAFAAGKPIVIYREDSRSGDCGRSHLLSGANTATGVTDRVEDIPPALEEAKERLLRLEVGTYAGAPPFVAQTVELGRKVDSVLKAVGFLKPGNMMSA